MTQFERILLRRGTAAQWTSANPTLAAGEPGYETDTGRHKLGDGATTWTALPYQATRPAVAATVTTDGALAIDKHNPVDATSGNRTMTLADATAGGQTVTVSKKDASSNTVTINVAHMRDVGASSEQLVGQYEAITFLSKADGSWWPVSGHKTKTWLTGTFALTTWAAATFYAAGKLVTFAGHVWRCTTAHTSGSAFSTANWTPLGLAPVPNSAWRPFLAALANRASAPCVVLCGPADSVTEGQGATTTGARWVKRFADRLRTLYPTTGASGGEWLEINPQANSYPYPWTLAGGTPATDNSFGLNRRAINQSSAITVSRTVTGTSLDIWWVQGTSTGTINVSVSGGGSATINTVGSLTDGKRTRVTFTAPGSNTVTITVTGNNSYVTGLYVYNGDENAGIQVYDGGHYGWTTDDWVNNGGAVTFTNYHKACVATLQPHLVDIFLGLNDQAKPITSAAYKANLKTIISTYRSALTHPATFVVTVPYLRGGTYAEPWQNYVDAAWQIADEDTGGIGGASGVVVDDLSQRMTGAADNTLGFLSGDLLHPANTGQGFIGEHKAKSLDLATR